MDDTLHRIPTQACAGFISLIFAVFACGSRFVDDERLNIDAKGAKSDEGMGMVYYER
jgi:hypothetical protein